MPGQIDVNATGITALDKSVDNAAPLAPICGAPSLPNISTQLRNMLSMLQPTVIAIGTVEITYTLHELLERQKIM